MEKNRERSFYANDLMNASHIFVLWTLLPRDFWAHLPYTLALFNFLIVATLNHLFPYRLAPLTHVVKAAYTLLLFAALSLDFRLGFLLACIDLMPLLLGVGFWKKTTESIGAISRMALIGYGFYLVHWNVYLLSFFLLCNGIYYVERRARIKKGKRYDYGWSHAFEHFAIFAFLYTVTYDNLNPTQVWVRYMGTALVLFVGLTIFGLFTNFQLYRNRKKNTPPWFDENLLPKFYRKIHSNFRSLKICNYICKPFANSIVIRKLQWKDIESMIDRIPVEEPIDIVAGLSSGGAFIAKYVAEKNKIGTLAYLESKLWSDSSFVNSCIKVYKFHRGISLLSDVSCEYPESFFQNKNVLLVDDSCCSGGTLRAASSLLTRLGAKKISTYVLFCNPKRKVDYCFAREPCPLIWPWGWEAD